MKKGRSTPPPPDVAADESVRLMQQLRQVLSGADRAAALEAIGNILVLLAVECTRTRKAAHGALDEVLPQLHHCMEINYEHAQRLLAESERHGATLH